MGEGRAAQSRSTLRHVDAELSRRFRRFQRPPGAGHPRSERFGARLEQPWSARFAPCEALRPLPHVEPARACALRAPRLAAISGSSTAGARVPVRHVQCRAVAASAAFAGALLGALQVDVLRAIRKCSAFRADGNRRISHVHHHDHRWLGRYGAMVFSGSTGALWRTANPRKASAP
jgi:hypothetical protein